MARESSNSGQPVDFIPSASPAMILVAAPVWAAAATARAGFLDSEV
jgi:hypothetical protein